MERNSMNLEYISPSMELIEITLEGSILTSSSGTAGQDAGGEEGWDE